MSRKLSDLALHFQSTASVLLADCKKAGIPVTIIDTLRTEAEHKQNLANGTSWIKRSKHLDGLAIDICPTELLKTKGWSPTSPLWQKIGEIGEKLGLRWGGRWKKRDLGHFELVV